MRFQNDNQKKVPLIQTSQEFLEFLTQTLIYLLFNQVLKDFVHPLNKICVIFENHQGK